MAAHYSKKWWFPDAAATAAVGQRAVVFGPGDTNILATIYADPALTTILPNPTSTNAGGILDFYVPDDSGMYWVFVGGVTNGESEEFNTSGSTDDPVLSVNGIVPDGVGNVELDAIDVGAQPVSVIQAKGDLYAGVSNDFTVRLPVGADGQVLVADSATLTGLQWQVPPSAPVTSVNSQTGAVVLTAPDVGAQPIGTIDAKGDLYAGTGSDTTTRLPVGANNTVLSANSATSTGLEWVVPPTAPVTSVNTQTGAVVLTATDVGAATATRNLIAGIALSGGGNLTADRTFDVDLGTTAGSAAAGDDSRITGAIQSSTVDAKGDLLAATADNVVTRLAVGTNGQALVANSATSTGLEWQALPSAPVTSVNGETGVVVLDAADVGAVPITRDIDTINGLSGGGELSIDRTIQPVYGTTALTIAEGNDARIVDAQPRSVIDAKGDLYAGTADNTTTRLPVGTNGQVVRANSATGTGLEYATLTSTDVGAVPTDRDIDTINGLSGGGDLSVDRTIQPVYGTTALTITEGNDTRVTGAQQRSALTAKGSIYAATASAVTTELPVGTNGQVVRANSATSTGLEYASLTSADVGAQPIATIDAKGDLYVGTADNATTRLPVGANNQLLRANSATGTGLEWATTGSGDVVGPASATDNGLARYDLTTGKLIQNSLTTLDDAGTFTLQPQTGVFSVTPNALIFNGDSLLVVNTAATVVTAPDQQEQLQVRNATGVTIPINSLVYINGNTGALDFTPTVALAQANSLTTSRVAGITREDIVNGANGMILTSGNFFGANTSAATIGSYMYLSEITPGALTILRPLSPNYVVPIGIVGNVHATLGGLDVKIGPPDLGLSTSGLVLTQQSSSPLEKRWVIQSSVGVYPRSFGFVPAGGVATSRSPHSAPLGKMYLLPFMLLAPETLAQIAFEVTAGNVGAVCRLGVYGTNNGPDPVGSPLADFGTIAAATTGVKAMAVSLALNASEVYYLAIVGQTVAPTLRFFKGFNPYVASGFFPSATNDPGWNVSYTIDTVLGALPPISAVSVDEAPVVGLSF